MSDGAGDATKLCSPWSASTQFTTPQRASELGGGDQEQQPHLTSDGLRIYWSSFRSSAYHIYTADRPSREQAFTNVRSLDEVNSGTNDFDTAFAPTEDELTAYLASDRGQNPDLWVTQRSMRSQPWQAPVLFAGSTSFTDYDPFPSSDGLRLYWVILDWDQGIGATDIVVASRATTATSFGAPVLVSGLATALDDDNPSETADGRMLVFSSDRSGDFEIYFATRAATTAAYTAANLVPDVNSGVDDVEAFVTPDGCELWFVSNRGGAYDVYVARVVGG
jgi:Tol biopolymer transport system component